MRTGRPAVAATVLAFLCLGGCASFRAGRLQPIHSWPPGPVTGTPSISIAVTGVAITNGREEEIPPELLDLWSEETIEAYRDSGLFSDVTVELGKTDFHAEVRILERVRFNRVVTYLAPLTLWLVPAKLTDEFVLTTTIKHRQGNRVSVFRKSETLDTWVHLFMVFAMPSRFHTSVAMETLLDLNRATIVEAHSMRALLVRPPR